MDPASAAKIVAACDAALASRWRKRRDSAQAQSRAEAEADPALVAAQDALERAQSDLAVAQADLDACDPEDAAPAEERLTAVEAAHRGLSAARSSSQVWRSVLVLARSLEWHSGNPPPAGAIAEPVDQAAQDERERVRAWCDERGGLGSVLREIVRKAERLCDQAEREADPTIPKRRTVIIGPRHQSILGLASDPAAGSAKAKTVDAKSGGKRSRTEIALEKQQAEAAARQALLPPRPAQPARSPLGWFRGVVQSFDQRLAVGVIRFSGAAGFTEASLAPGAFRGSGLTS
jgi:hypothetical protein